MAGSPVYKVYDSKKNYVASCKHLEACAALANLYGEGTTIRYGHGKTIIWTEGKEEQPAGESYDYVAEVCTKRVDEFISQYWHNLK